MKHSNTPVVSGAERPEKLIGLEGIAKLTGLDKNWPSKMQREQPTFPAAAQGGPGMGRSLWREQDIIEFLITYRTPKKGANTLDKLTSLDNAMVQQVIRRGWQRGGRAIGRAVLDGAVRAGGAL